MQGLQSTCPLARHSARSDMQTACTNPLCARNTCPCVILFRAFLLAGAGHLCLGSRAALHLGSLTTKLSPVDAVDTRPTRQRGHTAGGSSAIFPRRRVLRRDGRICHPRTVASLVDCPLCAFRSSPRVNEITGQSVFLVVFHVVFTDPARCLHLLVVAGGSCRAILLLCRFRVAPWHSATVLPFPAEC